jgi:hypothetical protein
MHSGDQSNFVAADIKDGEFSDLVGVRKDLSQLREIQKSAFLHNRVPMRERCLRVRVLFSKLIQTFPGNDVHLGGETLTEPFSGEKRGKRVFQPPTLITASQGGKES